MHTGKTLAVPDRTSPSALHTEVHNAGRLSGEHARRYRPGRPRATTGISSSPPCTKPRRRRLRHRGQLLVNRLLTVSLKV